MVQCVRCSDWFHEQCAKEKYRASHGCDVDLEDESVDFVCETCERSGVGDGEKAGDDGMSVHCDNAISKPGDNAVSKHSDTPISKPTDPSQPSDTQNAPSAPEDTHDEETRLEKQIRALFQQTIATSAQRGKDLSIHMGVSRRHEYLVARLGHAIELVIGISYGWNKSYNLR